MDVPENFKETENPSNYDAMTSQWPQLSESNLINTSIATNLIPNSMVESSSCSSAPLAFDHSINAQNLSHYDVINIASEAMLRGNSSSLLLQNLPRTMMIPPNLPHFPADLGFIERAAKFSSFSGGDFSDASFERFPYSQLPLSENQPQRHEMIAPSKNDEIINGAQDMIGSFLAHDVSNDGQRVSNNAEFSGKGSKACKKRKRNGQDMENDQERGKLASNDDQEPSIETTSNNNMLGSKSKHGKNVKESSDQQPKEGYIHVRARRGQATNSHSLAERVRREKISERMKFLQDLVPGCSKVTGKAVMLDEIVNYVQSLQRQVEFLSMKLATVNPRLDFHFDGLLAKDILQHRGVGLPSSSSSFPLNTSSLQFPQLHHLLTNNNTLGNNASPSNNLRLTESFRRVSNVWDEDLHNVVEMRGFDSSAAALNSHDEGLSGSLPPEGRMKTEP